MYGGLHKIEDQKPSTNDLIGPFNVYFKPLKRKSRNLQRNSIMSKKQTSDGGFLW